MNSARPWFGRSSDPDLDAEVREAIAAGHNTTPKLMGWLGISRTRLHYALRRLKRDGLAIVKVPCRMRPRGRGRTPMVWGVR